MLPKRRNPDPKSSSNETRYPGAIPGIEWWPVLWELTSFLFHDIFPLESSLRKNSTRSSRTLYKCFSNGEIASSMRVEIGTIPRWSIFSDQPTFEKRSARRRSEISTSSAVFFRFVRFPSRTRRKMRRWVLGETVVRGGGSTRVIFGEEPLTEFSTDPTTALKCEGRRLNSV